MEGSYLLPDERAVKLFQAAAEQSGYSTRSEPMDSSSEALDVTATTMLPLTAEAITRAEELLNSLAHLLGGRPDGWGFES